MSLRLLYFCGVEYVTHRGVVSLILPVLCCITFNFFFSIVSTERETLHMGGRHVNHAWSPLFQQVSIGQLNELKYEGEVEGDE